MAETIEVGELVVRLIADAKQLEGALKKSDASLKRFGDTAEKNTKRTQTASARTERAISGVAARLSGLVAAYLSVDLVAQAFNQTVSDVTAFDHLSQPTGVSVERLSELRGIVLQLGLDFPTVSQAFVQFGARMTESLASPTSRGSQAIRALGVDVRDAAGNIRQLDEMLPELAERFAQFADGSNKAAIASALFGEEAGPKLIPLLNRGRAGVEELRRAIGTTVTADDVQRVREYQQATGQLQIAFHELMRELTTNVAPTLTAMAQAMADALREINERLTPARQIETVKTRIQTIQTEMGGLNERFRQGRVDLEQYNLQMEQLSLRLGNAQKHLQQLQSAPAITTTSNRPQAPGLDPFAMERSQITLAQLQERLLGTRSIFDEVNASWQAHGELVTRTLEQIDRTHEQGHRREAARHRIERQLMLLKEQQMLDVASSTAQTSTALWPKQKGAAIAAAVINTAVGVTNAIRTGIPPWNLAQAALIAAQGAAQIATIRSTNESGGGGSASSGVAQAPTPAEVPESRSLTINGVDPAHLFSGGQVRGLIESINEEVRNGVTLISSGRLAA